MAGNVTDICVLLQEAGVYYEHVSDLSHIPDNEICTPVI